MQRIVLILTFLFFFSTGSTIAQYEIRLSDSYPPYNYTNESGELVGFNIDIIDAINEIYDSKIHYEGGNWHSINEALETGEIQAIGGAHFPGSFGNDYIYTRSTINTSHCFFYNTNHLDNFSLKVFRTLREPLVALWPNDVLEHYVISINPTVEFIYVKNYTDLINSIDRKDITCIFGQRIGSMYYAEKLGKDYIMPLDHRILERNMGFKVNRDNPELASMLNDGLEVILANGEYQRIYDKWITNYNKHPNTWEKYFRYIVSAGLLITVVFLLLIVFNRILRNRVHKKTKDLQKQLDLNSQIMKELEEQKIKAEESDKMKSAFLANMSHEIRTPMNGILGFTNLLRSADYSQDKQAQFIDIISKSGNRMLDTINNIIDASKLESGLEKTQISQVSVQGMINDLYDFFTPEASSKGLIFDINDNSEGSDIGFFTDSYKLNSILTNLIKNALKFTDKGSIIIDYSIDSNNAEFQISDTGIGISADKQKSVFDQFVQADSSYSSGYEGSGLGLAITKGYVNLLKGKIELKSEPGKGTTFNITIPNNSDPDLSSSIIVNADTKPNKSSKYNILIVEDDETSFDYLKIILKDYSKKIIHARDGLEAVEKTRENKDTDIILMDIKIPKLNGFEATKEIRNFNKDVYIIAQSAFTQEKFKTKIIECGCDSYISKPIDQKQLIKIISEIPVLQK